MDESHHETGPPAIETLAEPGDRAGRYDVDAERHVHIVLLGLMGSGKSTAGRIVANELSRPYVDSDSLVELRTGHGPDRLAETAGVEELHAVEESIARDVLSSRDSVLFAAAASVVDTLDRDALSNAWAVWLETSPEVLSERVRDGGSRPLLDDTPLDELTEQHESRAQRGQALADLVIDTDHLSAREVAIQICHAWRQFVTTP